MKHPSNLYSRLSLIASITLVVGYFIVQAATLYYTDLPNVASGSGLTATSWNNLVNYANKAIKQDTEILTVTGGRVGIGTTNPGSKLDIKINTAGTYFRGTASTDGGRGLSITSSDNGIYLGAIHNFDIASAAGIYAFSINSVEKVRINSDGNIGIGTTSPFVPSIGANPWLTIKSTSPGINLFDGDTTPGYKNRYIRVADGIMNLGRSSDDGTTSLDQITLDFAGYVGIWVPSPTYRLQLPNTASVAWQWQANAWVTYSDGRVKTDKETLRYGISEIMKMDPKQYVHHSSEFQSWSLVVTSEWMHTIGFIAQELEKIIPEAVNKPKDDSKELWSVDYNKIVPILVNAMKEQQKQITLLQTEIQRLKNGE